MLEKKNKYVFCRALNAATNTQHHKLPPLSIDIVGCQRSSFILSCHVLTFRATRFRYIFNEYYIF